MLSYIAARLYRLKPHLPRFWKSSNWTWPFTAKRKSKHSKQLSVDLLPVTGLPPPPSTLPITPLPLVDISPAFPTSSYQHLNKQIHSLHPISYSRPPSPHPSLSTTPPPKLPRRSRSLGGVPVRRLSGGAASCLRNVQFLDRDVEMQEMMHGRSSSREHLLIDFSSSGSSDDLDGYSRTDDGMSRIVSPISSDIGVLPFHRPSLFDEGPLVDLAPGRKVLPLVDLDDVEAGVNQPEEDTWKWLVSPPPLSAKSHPTTPLEAMTPISKSVSEPLPMTTPKREHVLVDLDVQEDDVPQQQQHSELFMRVHVTPRVGSEPLLPTALPLDADGRRSLDSLMKPMDTAPQGAVLLPVMKTLSQRGQRVDRHPLEEVDEQEVVVVVITPEKPAIADEQPQQLVVVDDIYDHHDDVNDKYDDDDKHEEEEEEEYSPQSLDTVRESLPRVVVQQAPAWYWDREDDPWNGAVTAGGEGVEAEDEGRVEGEEERDLMEVEDDVEKTGGMECEVVGSPVEEVRIETEEEAVEEAEEEESYPDPDYLPLPELSSSSSPSEPSSPLMIDAPDIPLVLIGHEQDEEEEEKKSPRQAASQMPTPPASPPPAMSLSPLRVRGLRSGPPSPNSDSDSEGLPITTTATTPLTPKLGLTSLVLTPPPTAAFTIEVAPSVSPVGEKMKMRMAGGDKENAVVVDDGGGDELRGRPLWSIRAGDAPALGLAASSLLVGGVRRRVLGDVNAGGEDGREKDVLVKEKEEEKEEIVFKEGKEEEEEEKEEEKEDQEDEEEEEEDSSLPGAFPDLVKSTNDTIVAPTITIAALTSTLLSTSIAAASSSSSSSTQSTTTTSSSTTTALAETSSSPTIKRRGIVRSPLDIALAMQLRPGLGVGADPAWMVRFLMAMFGWFAILVSGQGEF